MSTDPPDHELFETLYQESVDLIFLMSPEGKIQARNPAAAACGPAEHLSEVFEESQSIREFIERDFVGVGERDLTLCDGRRVLLAPMRLESGLILVSLRDITGYRALEVELESTRRLASLGELARLVAREISAPLSIILGRLELLGTIGYSEPQIMKKHLRVVEEHAQRVAASAVHLELLASPCPQERLPVDLTGLLLALAEQRGLTDKLRVVSPQPQIKVLGDRSRLYQAMESLILPSLHATPRSGTLRVECRVEGDQVLLTLEGEGLSAVSQPLQRLQSWRRGNPLGLEDLGLAVGSTLLQEHGGSIQVLGVGGLRPSIQIRLPCLRQDPHSDHPQRCRVLVVEDEQSTALWLRELLQMEGHIPDIAPTGEEALNQLGRTQDYQAIFCDLALPGISGFTLHDTIGRRWPELSSRVILMSGFSSPRGMSTRFLRKPFSRLEFLSALQELLESLDS